jgi:DNA-directed RNA polymerase subunit RPC12/RpoP
MFTCLECERNIDIDEDVDVDDIIVCPDCELKMVVLSTQPPTVDYAE